MSEHTHNNIAVGDTADKRYNNCIVIGEGAGAAATDSNQFVFRVGKDTFLRTKFRNDAERAMTERLVIRAKKECNIKDIIVERD